MTDRKPHIGKGQFDFTHHTLDNGLTVLLYPVTNVDSFYIRALVRSGRGYENMAPFGISHFVEHYVHQGSEKYPDQQSFRTQLEKRGMMQNASTGLTFTDYWIKGLSNQVEDGIDLLHELVAKPIFPAGRLEHVRDVILNEYQDMWQSPERQFYYYFFKKLFTDSPYLTEHIVGSPDDISAITKEDCVAWYTKYYTASNIILTLSGNFDINKALDIITKVWSDVPKGTETTYPYYAHGNYSDASVYHFPEEREQVTFALSFPSFGELEKSDFELAAFRTGAAVLGGGMLSRLFQKLREEHNLVYRIGSDPFMDFYRGEVRISGMCMKENVVRVVQMITDEVRRLVSGGITAEELEIHKNRLASRVAFRYESYESVAEYLDGEMAVRDITKKFRYPHDYLQDYLNLKVDDVNKSMDFSWDFSKLTIGLFGSVDEKTIREIEKMGR